MSKGFMDIFLQELLSGALGKGKQNMLESPISYSCPLSINKCTELIGQLRNRVRAKEAQTLLDQIKLVNNPLVRMKLGQPLYAILRPVMMIQRKKKRG